MRRRPSAATAVAGTFTYTPAAGTVLNAGQSQTLAVSFTPTDTADFNNATASVLINVAPAPLTVTVNNASKVYGQPNPAFSVTYSGFVNGDTASSLGGTLAFSTAATSASDVGSYDVTASGLTSSNYAITYVDGDAEHHPGRPDDRLEHPGRHHLRHAPGRGATECDGLGGRSGPGRHVDLYPGGGDRPRRRQRADADRRRRGHARLQPGHRQRSDQRPEGNADDHLGQSRDIVPGTPLGPAQLDATASVPGTFVYTPAAGFVLNAGPDKPSR